MSRRNLAPPPPPPTHTLFPTTTKDIITLLGMTQSAIICCLQMLLFPVIDTATLCIWLRLFFGLSAFRDSIFQSISGRLPERGEKERNDRRE